MNKCLRIIISFCLSLCLVASGVLVFCADNTGFYDSKGLHIRSLNEFLVFADNCRLDSYSQDLNVYLEVDLDLSETEFSGVPIFCGTFEGDNHTITGLNITSDGSVQGLFRYLTETAHVKNLIVEGTVAPKGSGKYVGGIAGDNSGKIENCSFKGEVSGTDSIGGIAGTNKVTGIIESCNVSGSVYGNHFVGGIVGENFGTVRSCANLAEINVTEKQNTVDLSDISLDSLTDSESANTVTDIGGIAGTSSGVIRECNNLGNVGYLRMGYNIGGIAGSQVGYIADCNNFAKIYGRKDVGGIVGQAEPTSEIEYSMDTLQIFQQKLNDVYDLFHHIPNSVEQSNSYLNGQFEVLGKQLEEAAEYVPVFFPEEDGTMPEHDTVQSAVNSLSASMNDIYKTLSVMYKEAESTANSMYSDAQEISEQIDSMVALLCNPYDSLGVGFHDISDEDTEDNLTGKIENSPNYGSVSGDLNVGGIVGTIAWENDLDAEDDWQISGDISMNFRGKVRAVVLNSTNYALVSATKRNAGGIIGYMAFGLVKECVNGGKIDAASAEYVGGIAGDSTGFLRSNSAKCELSGSVSVGGIAGRAVTVTDCISMIDISEATEKTGAIMGIKGTSSLSSEEDGEIENNYYLVVHKDFGGIDGINYEGAAVSLDEEDFFDLPELDDIFTRAAVTFVGEDGISEIVFVPTGERLSASEIPAVPEKDGYNGEWENLENADLSNIYFDLIFYPVYDAYQVTVQSRLTRYDGKPILIAQGNFPDMDYFELEKVTQLPTVAEKEKAVEGWVIPNFSEDKTQLRFSLPRGCDADAVKILVKDEAGDWKETAFTVSSSYVVFSVDGSDDAFCVVSVPESVSWWVYVIGAAAAVAIIAGAVIVIKKKSKRKIERN